MWFLIIDTTSCAARFASASKSKPFSNTTFKSTNVLPAASLPSSVCFNYILFICGFLSSPIGSICLLLKLHIILAWKDILPHSHRCL